MKKTIAILTLILALTVFASAVEAKSISADDAANALGGLGLLAGVGTNADGSTNYDTDGGLTRAQAITQVVRFLGKETAAMEETVHFHSPFTDVPSWAEPYVLYANAHSITQGVGQTQFGSNLKMNDASFLTAILRVLGYSDANGEFVWDNPYALAKQVGLIASETPDASFTRGDAFIICFNALEADTKSGDSIAKQLQGEGVFTEAQYAEVKDTVGAQKTDLLSISQLNQKSENGDHAADDYRTSSLEINFRENVDLTAAATGHFRYEKAWYPRAKRINDSLYLMTYMYNQHGQHLYYATSSDGVEWNSPEVLWNSADYPAFTYTYGSLAGTSDRYHAMNPDFCVLDDGRILCVYAVRAVKGYRTYPEYCGIFIKYGTFDENNNITWSREKKIYNGQVWEPSVLQREDGQIHVYFTQVAFDIVKYGYHESHRSTGTGLIVSNDGFKTWTPDVKGDDSGFYRAYHVFSEYLGELDGRPHYNGQMPVATQLYNGKILLVTEIDQLDGKFHISYAVSEDGGKWKDLKEHEVGDGIQLTTASNASPYVDRFLSGEVYVTNNHGGGLVGRMGAADGSAFGNTFKSAPDAAGIWGSCSVVDTHRAITAMQSKNGDLSGIKLYSSYLNHRVNAPSKTVTVDGYTADWDGNTDALFVGSVCQAQVNLRTAHDSENIYFLISRNDYYLTDGDTVTVCIGDTDSSDYRITVDLFGNVTLDYYSGGTKKSSAALGGAKAVILGTLGDNSDKDSGAVIELAVPKAVLALTAKQAFPVRLALTNADGKGSITDTFTGASVFNTKFWPKVVLD